MNIPQNQHPGLWCESRELRGGKRPESGQAVDVPETGTVMARYSGGCPLGQWLRARCLRPAFGTRQWVLLTGECGSSWLAAQVWGCCELEQPGAEGLLAFQRRNWTHHREESCWIPTLAGEDSGRRQRLISWVADRRPTLSDVPGCLGTPTLDLTVIPDDQSPAEQGLRLSPCSPKPPISVPPSRTAGLFKLRSGIRIVHFDYRCDNCCLLSPAMVSPAPSVPQTQGFLSFYRGGHQAYLLSKRVGHQYLFL